MAETQRWQAIPTQLELAEFEQFVLPHLSIGSGGPAPKLSLYKIFNYVFRSYVASSARAHGHPLYPLRARSGCGRGQFSSPCGAASGGARNLRARQHRAGWQDPARQFRQLS
jgi:hypothetical protein